MNPTIIDLSHQRTHTFSLLIGGYQEKKWRRRQSGCRNDAKKKKKNVWEQKISTKFEYRKWVQKWIQPQYKPNRPLVSKLVSK